jgi:hypothetical protein
MQLSFKVLIFWLCLSFPLLLRGQGTGNSPFSQFGIGDITNNYGSVRNIGMGSSGVSARNYQYINFLNPALLTNLSFVKIDFALNYQSKSIQANGYENASGMNVAYLNFALPISKSWGSALGIVPYSTVNYNLTYNAGIVGKPNTTTTIQNNGKGGVYKLFWSNGFDLTKNKNLSVGLETAYLFGNINNEQFSTIPILSTKNYGFKRQSTYSAFGFKPGIQFRRQISIGNIEKDTVYRQDSTGNKVAVPRTERVRKKTGVFYSVGLTYDFFTTLNIARSLNLYTLDATNHIALDTTVETNKYTAKLPSTFRLGATLDAPLKWTIAADVFYSPWGNYKNGFTSDTMANSYGLNIGGEFSRFLRETSKTYRIGFSYLKTPVIYHNHQLDDMSLSIGTSIPVGKKKKGMEVQIMPIRAKLNLALVLGQRGNISDFGIKEQYVKVYFSFLINQKWFEKSKIY